MDRKEFLASIRPASQAAHRHVRSLDAAGKLAYKAELKQRRAEKAREWYRANKEAYLARRKELREAKLNVVKAD